MTDVRPTDVRPTDVRPTDVWAIVVAGGTGSRLGGAVAKQYLQLGGRPVIEWSLRAARVAFGDHVVLVVPPDRLNEGQPLADRVVAGGESRTASVRAGLAAVPADAKVIVVHDGARPFATPDLFTAVVTAVNNGADAAVPAIVVVDTLKRVDGTTVVETLDRSSIVAVQTPQAFRATVLRDAHRLGGSATDDAALVEAIGGTVVWVAGSEENRKLTTPEDLWWFTARAATR